MRIRFIPTAAIVALEESMTQMDFADGDGWAMSQDYAMRVLSPLCRRLPVAARGCGDSELKDQGK
jgi:hypothetical protein